VGLLVPGGVLALVSAYVVLGGGGGCTATGGTPQHTGSCAGNAAEVAVITFPLAVLCLVLCAAVLRGARWSRWPAVVVGAVLATITAAAALAGVTAMGGDGSDVPGAIAVGLCGLALAAFSALPPVLLSGERGAQAFPEPERPEQPEPSA
jgi:cytochrome bd-type quinol oxidase subunit 2